MEKLEILMANEDQYEKIRHNKSFQCNVQELFDIVINRILKLKKHFEIKEDGIVIKQYKDRWYGIIEDNKYVRIGKNRFYKMLLKIGYDETEIDNIVEMFCENEYLEIDTEITVTQVYVLKLYKYSNFKKINSREFARLKACEKFGFVPDYEEFEYLYGSLYKIPDNESREYWKIFYHWLKSLYASGYDLSHPDFNEYAKHYLKEPICWLPKGSSYVNIKEYKKWRKNNEV